MPMPTKANSPPGPSSRPISTATGQDRRKSLARPMISSDLTAIRPTTAPSSKSGSRNSSRTSMSMPTVKKKIPSSRPLNGSMVASIGLAIFGLGEQQAGDESAERHGETGLIGDDAGGDDDEQHGGDEELAGARRRDQPEQRTQQNAAEHDDDGERDRGLQQRDAEARKHRSAGPRGEDGDEHQDRNDGEVLRQQHGKAGAADIRREALLVRQQFEHDRGRGQRQARAEDDGFARALARTTPRRRRAKRW